MKRPPICWLQSQPNYKIRDNMDRTINEIIHLLVDQTKNVPQNKLYEWCMKNNPRLVVYDVDTKQELIYDYVNGYVGEQLQLQLKV